MARLPVVMAAVAIALSGCGEDESSDQPLPPAPDEIRVVTVVPDGQPLPRVFTCDSEREEVSPQVGWTAVPDETEELALLMVDLDAENFLHWSVYGLDNTSMLALGQVPSGARQGENDFGATGYGGPCPPEGDDPHRYTLALYALDRQLDLAEGASPQDVRDAVEEAAIARGRVTVRYGRQ